MADRLDILLQMALEEDIGHGDVTSESIFSAEARGRAAVVGRESLVLSGSEAFLRIFSLLDPGVRIEILCRDGERVASGQTIFRLEGAVLAILKGERTALNLVQRLSGIATRTRELVDALAGTGCRLLDTRKTTPLWRLLEKQAVRHGGGSNHRFNLADGVLIKDNHIAAVGSVTEAVRRARAGVPHTLRIEVEVDTLEQFEEALEAGADIILLDNFTPEMLHRAVARNGGQALLEASGGVTLENVRAIGETGVDLVSCGAITHSARAVDIALDWSPGV